MFLTRIFRQAAAANAEPPARRRAAMVAGSLAAALLIGASAASAQAPGYVPRIAIQTMNVDEGDAGTVEVVFRLTQEDNYSGVEVKVDYATLDETAKVGEDYAEASGTLTFAPGELEKTISVTVFGDVLPEADETFCLVLSNPVNAELDISVAVAKIRNDDSAFLSIADLSLPEGNAGASDATFRVTLAPASTLPVSLNYATADGTAKAGEDYRAARGALTFAPGETEKSIAVAILGDPRPEADETFRVILSGAVNGELERAEAAGTIENDDRAALSIADLSLPEGNAGASDATFRVTLAPASTLPVSLNYATADGTAKAGEDYRTARGALTFAPGETEKSIAVAILGDPRPEADETFRVILSGAVNGELERAEAAGTIENDDLAVLSIADLSLPEGDAGASDATFRVTLAPAGDLPVSLNYATADGTAKAGEDYRAASGALTFAPGETEKSIAVAILGDPRPEADETFRVILSGAVNGELERAEAAGTIENDDLAVLSIADLSLPEGDAGASDATFRVTLAPAGDLPVSLNYATADGTAKAGEDYRAASGALTFAPGETEKSIAVAISGDGIPEEDETFRMILSGATNGELNRAEATCTITDDDTDRVRSLALEKSLAAFARTMGADAVDAIGQRMREGPAAASQATLGGQLLGLNGALPAGRGDLPWEAFARSRLHDPRDGLGDFRAQRSRNLSFGEFLSLSSFDLRLDGGQAGDGLGWNFWGRGSLNRYSGQPGGGLQLDGDFAAGYLGADVQLAEPLLLGLALSRSSAEMDYQLADARGELDTNVTSLLPYSRWTVRDGLDVWGMLGIGWGEADLMDELGMDDADLEMQLAALGARNQLLAQPGYELSLKADGFFVSLDAEAEANASPMNLDAKAERMRLMLDGRGDWVAASDYRLGWNLEFGGRWDGGDGERGMGAELGGGLDYRHVKLGLGIQARGRYLLAHEESGFDDWGLSLALELDPGAAGLGPSLTLAPTWGDPTSQAHSLWRSERMLGKARRGPEERMRRPDRLDVEFGYGFATWGNQGLHKLYSAVSSGGANGQRYRLGWRMEMNHELQLSLELDREARFGDAPAHGILLRAELRR